MTRVAVAKITKAELWEFVAVTGYLQVVREEGRLPEGREAVVVSGQLLRVTYHVQTGWAELLIGPPPDNLKVWVPPGTEIEVEKSD